MADLTERVEAVVAELVQLYDENSEEWKAVLQRLNSHYRTAKHKVEGIREEEQDPTQTEHNTAVLWQGITLGVGAMAMWNKEEGRWQEPELVLHRKNPEDT